MPPLFPLPFLFFPLQEGCCYVLFFGPRHFPFPFRRERRRLFSSLFFSPFLPEHSYCRSLPPFLHPWQLIDMVANFPLFFFFSLKIIAFFGLSRCLSFLAYTTQAFLPILSPPLPFPLIDKIDPPQTSDFLPEFCRDRTHGFLLSLCAPEQEGSFLCLYY